MAENNPSSRDARGGKDVDALRADIEALRSDVERLTGRIKGIGTSTVQSAKRQGAETIERVRAEAETLADEVAATGRSQLAEFEKKVQREPIVAVAVAFGLGALLAKLSDRR